MSKVMAARTALALLRAALSELIIDDEFSGSRARKSIAVALSARACRSKNAGSQPAAMIADCHSSVVDGAGMTAIRLAVSKSRAT